MNSNLIYETLWTGTENDVFISVLGNLGLFDWSNNTGPIGVKIAGSIVEEKSSFKMLGLPFSSKLDWGSYILSIIKTASKKIGALIRCMKFVSPEVAVYLH